MNGEVPKEYDEIRENQIRRFLDIESYHTGTLYRLSPDQVAEYRSKLQETVITALLNQWRPDGGANVYSYAQKVVKRKRKELIRLILKDRATEMALGRKTQLRLENGQKALLTRDWDNDDELDKPSIVEELPGPFSKRAFDTLYANMDYGALRAFLTTEERRIFAALCKAGGKVERARFLLGKEKHKRTHFHEKVVPALRYKLSKIK